MIPAARSAPATTSRKRAGSGSGRSSIHENLPPRARFPRSASEAHSGYDDVFGADVDTVHLAGGSAEGEQGGLCLALRGRPRRLQRRLDRPAAAQQQCADLIDRRLRQPVALASLRSAHRSLRLKCAQHQGRIVVAGG